jgi:ligand-binding SRPBCC domain-containing protein
VVVETRVDAPVERAFDLARSVELHVESAAATEERAVAGKTSGLLGRGDWVTWEAHHLARRRRLTVRVTAFDPPHSFRDEQVSGPFARFRHDNFFEAEADGTRMTDSLDFASRVPAALPRPEKRRDPAVRARSIVRPRKTHFRHKAVTHA